MYLYINISVNLRGMVPLMIGAGQIFCSRNISLLVYSLDKNDFKFKKSD